MTEREQLEQAVAQLEAQRITLGNAAVEAALAGLRQKLAELERIETQRPTQPAPSALVGERKLVTVMFADISGFTALSEKMDPESMRDLINRCFDKLVPCIRRYDGTIDKFIGDGIMVLFGAPVAHENDPERALRAALEMQVALAKFNAERDTQLGIHFGINTGLVLAGGIGSSGQQEYSVMGDTVNLAARLEGVSERGQVLVGPDTYRLTAPLFEFETLPPVSVKGKSEPVPVYRLIGAKGGAVTVRGLAPRGLSSPLVGRSNECQALQKCIATVRGGQGGVVAVIGEAGLGKSRLMVEIRCDVQGVQWLEGKTLSYGRTISYWPFQEILRSYAGIDEDDSELEAWTKLEQKIVALFPESALEILPYLSTLLAVEVQGEYVERVKYLDGDALGKRVFLAVRRFAERLARTQPLVLVFEDLHWMDTSSAGLLEHLLVLVREVPLLVIGVSRPDPNTAAARLREVCAEKYADVYTEVRLAPLSPSESVQLINNLLVIDNLPPQVHETMMHKAEGNPFFIEEIIRSLLDIGVIVRDANTGRWQATAQITSVHIPDTVQGVIMARIDRLDDDLKQALRVAAVIGRSFLYRILREVDQADGELDEHLAQLQQVELIRKKQVTPELEYIFKHALAQEATYESILIQRRKELHARVGECIEKLFAERLEEFYSLLAYHYAQAERWEKAQEYLFKAGDQAGKMAADSEALTHYQQAMEAYARVFGDKWDPVQRAMLERKIGSALYRRGRTDEAIEHLEAALGFLGRPLPETRRGRRLAILREVAVQMAHFIFPGWLVAPLKKDTTPAFTEEVATLGQLAWPLAYIRFEDTFLLSLRALNDSERRGYARGISSSLMGVGFGFVTAGLFSLAKNYLQRCLETAEFSGDPVAIAEAFGGLLVYYQGLGDFEEMVLLSQRVVKISRETGDLNEWIDAFNGLAVAYNYQGKLATAADTLKEMIDYGRELNDPTIIAMGASTLGLSLNRLGRLKEAEQCLRECVDLSMRIKNNLNIVAGGGELGRCYLRMGRQAEAEEILLFCEKIHRQAHIGLGMQMPLLHGLVDLYVAQGDLKKAELACNEALRDSRKAPLGMPESMRLRGVYEWLCGRRGAAQKWWQRALQQAEKQGQRYEEGMIHLEMGERLRERAHLEKAAGIFVEIGAEYDLAKARRALEKAEG